MNIKEFIIELSKSEVVLSVSDSKLIIDAPKGFVSEDMLLTIKKNKKEIIKYFNSIKSQEKYHSIITAVEKDYYPLSSSQKRLYLLQELDLESIAYNMPIIISLGVEEERSKIEEVLDQLIYRHDSLRTSFEIFEGEPVQRIHKQVDFNIEEFTIEKVDEHDIRNKFIQPFDLSIAPIIRVAIVHIKDEGSLLMIDMHHIISDATSHSILEREFLSLYSGEELLPLKLQYKDYAEWQNSSEQHIRIKGQEAFWLNKFKGEIPILELPKDYSRPIMQSYEGASVRFILTQKETKIIHDICKKQGLTLYMSLLSVFTILLSKISGQREVIVGSPIAARRHADLKDVVGMFVNTLAIRNNVSGDKRLIDYLQEFKKNIVEAYENQEYQFEDLVEKVDLNRDTSRNPIFDVMFNLLKVESQENQDSNKIELNHVQGISKFDLSLTAFDLGSAIQLSFEYSTKLFSPETIERFISYIREIIYQLPIKLSENISELEIITAKEKQQLLYEFNDTKIDYPKDKTIHQMFEDQIGRSPDKIAVCFENEKLSYLELNLKSNLLANDLIYKGYSNTLIGLMTTRSIEMIIGIMGILKSGNAYLPLDANHPKQRNSLILEESAVELLLTNIEDFQVDNITVIELCNNQKYDKNNTFPLIKTKSSDLAYIIYTSGSTGVPKGVMIEHRNVVNLLIGINKITSIKNSEILLSLTTVSFDIFGLELYTPLINGAMLLLANEEEQNSIGQISSIIKKNNVSILQLTPSRLKFILSDGLYSKVIDEIRVLLVGGEELSEVLLSELRKLYTGCVFNMYGPTETTIWSTCKDVSSNYSLNIGKPIVNTQIYILGDKNDLKPVGVIGELCISGEGLARGYYKNEKLTSEKFISHPFKKGERLYKTGDLARWLPDGNIEFLGRIDHQVKIRGFRIELGEIESCILKHSDVRECAVLSREDQSGEKYLCAYVVLKGKKKNQFIRSYLSGMLPDYMIPSYIVEIDSIPLTNNGKIDRKSLPEPEIKAGDAYQAPQSLIEVKLVKIWSEVLNIESKEISIKAAFFELGGHSLKAIKLVARIQYEFNVIIPLNNIFKLQTIWKIAEFIVNAKKNNRKHICSVEKKEWYISSSAQKRMYVAQQMNPEGMQYNISGAYKINGFIDTNDIEKAFIQIIKKHSTLRTIFIEINGNVVQKIINDFSFEIQVVEGEDDFNNLLKEFNKPFNLAKAPLIRTAIKKNNPMECELYVDMPHIISDGVSMSNLSKEFSDIMSDNAVLPLMIDYKDYSEYQNKYNNDYEFKKVESYWINKFKNGIPDLKFPIDFSRPEVRNIAKGGKVIHVIEYELFKSIKTAIIDTEVTLYIYLLAAYNILLHIYTRQEDIVVGTLVSGRSWSNLENVVGMFVNMLALRNQPVKSKSFIEFLNEVKFSTLEAFENQEYQFDDLVRSLGLQGLRNRNPIFDTNFQLNNIDQKEHEISGLKITPLELDADFAKFDLHFVITEQNDCLPILLRYSTEIFEELTIKNILSDYQSVLEQIVNDKEIKIQDIKLEHDLENAESGFLLNNDSDFDF